MRAANVEYLKTDDKNHTTAIRSYLKNRGEDGIVFLSNHAGNGIALVLDGEIKLLGVLNTIYVPKEDTGKS